jgi:hypothetical protein
MKYNCNATLNYATDEYNLDTGDVGLKMGFIEGILRVN